MEIINLTSENFEEEAVKAEGKVLIDFWATWCGPCRMIGPVLEKIAAGDPDFKICKVNVDDERDMAIKFGIDAIPTIILIKNGDTAAQAVGYMPKDELLSALGL